MKRFAVVAVLTLLAGCDALMNAPTPAPPRGSSIGVLPLLGSKFNLLHVGFTVFENGGDSCAAAPLDPDAYVREEAKKEIRKAAPGLRFVELECAVGHPCSSDDFSNAYQTSFAKGAFNLASISTVLQNQLAK